MEFSDDPGVVTGRRMLRLLRKSGALERDPTGVELRRILGTLTVREAMLVTIEQALRGEHALCREIVQRCDVEDRPTDVVAAELGMSQRSFFRYRQRALEAIATTIQRTLVARGALQRGTGRPAQLTLLGNFLLGLHSGEATAAALRSFGAAIELDPSAADAHVGLALAHVRSVTCLFRPPFERTRARRPQRSAPWSTRLVPPVRSERRRSSPFAVAAISRRRGTSSTKRWGSTPAIRLRSRRLAT